MDTSKGGERDKVRPIFGKDAASLALEDFSRASALVADSNAISRAILVGQMRNLGVGHVAQCSRVAETRAQLEVREFDFVLCERNFEDEGASGQDLLDDLRREQLIPFSTVFVMVTSEATYEHVAEAAESALDSFILKPHKESDLYDRILNSRRRKSVLLPVFQKIDAGDYEGAAELCMARFQSRSDYWLYAARIGAELMLRIGKTAQAQALYEQVIAARALPWAKLGVARAQLDSGQANTAIGTIENLLLGNASYADAYDVMARAYLESGDLDKALKTYETAVRLTPGSVVRLQKHAMVAFYLGDQAVARRELKKSALKASESKLFDYQGLVLLAVTAFMANDREDLVFCKSAIDRARAAQAHSLRIQRFGLTIDALVHMRSGAMGAALDAVSELCGSIRRDDFDFEAASNLISLLAAFSQAGADLGGLEGVVNDLGLRFCGTNGASEMLGRAALEHTPFHEAITACHEHVAQIAQKALALSMQGDPRAAVLSLVSSGESLKSPRLIDVAYLALLRYGNRVPDYEALLARVEAMKRAFGGGFAKPGVGDSETGRGGMKIRMGASAPRKMASRFMDAVKTSDEGLVSPLD